MSKIKTRDVVKGTIKTIDKGVIATQKTKETIVSVKEKSENSMQVKEQNSTEYATNRIEGGTRKVVNNAGYVRNKGNEAVRTTKNNIIKTKDKIKNIKTRLAEKKKIKATKKGIKTSKQVVKNTEKVAKETVKASQKAIKLAQNTAKKTYQGIKLTVKATITTVKAIIAATKALITAIIAGGWIALVVIVVICLIGLLCSSIFGIFFSGEKSSPNSITMRDAIIECNKEFSDKLQNIQDTNPHDEYELDGTMATWKDILIVYTVKMSNGINEQEVVTMDDNKKQILKDIFWDMNEISSEVKDEMVTERGTNTDELPKEVQKEVLHITISSKTAEQMKTQYSFNPLQLNQYNELMKDDYAMLWNGVIYGLDSGEYMSWRQRGATWSNIRIGNTTSTIGDIGCLVTSVAILIQKSGVNTATITPFNPGTFVEALNKVGGFSSNGSLQYAPISQVVPDFKYMGQIELRGKTREEKLSTITNYFNQGYYLTVEVKGGTPGNQHWVAVIGIDGNNIKMVDPATDHTDMWSAYEWSKTSQFNYFKAN